MGNSQEKSAEPIAKFTQRVKKTVCLTPKEYKKLKEKGQRAVKKRENKEAVVEEDEKIWDAKYKQCHAITDEKERLQFFFTLFFNTYPKLCIWTEDAKKFMVMAKEIDKWRTENVAHDAYGHIIKNRLYKLTQFKKFIGDHYSETLCEMNDWLETPNVPHRTNMNKLISLMSGEYDEYFEFLRSLAKYNFCPEIGKPKPPDIVLNSHEMYNNVQEKCKVIGGKYAGENGIVIKRLKKQIKIRINGKDVTISKKNVNHKCRE
tara:strand:+ start:8351 stop:9133 length:783 start_codon:yes stop_codon:yes gene_type:complete